MIHCDLKPENVLFRRGDTSRVKVVDFGSGCFLEGGGFSYVQSRFYRAPEVIIGMPYGYPIDMWSLGCMLAELYCGMPLFPGLDENEQLEFINLVMGSLPERMLAKAKKKKQFYKPDGSIICSSRSRIKNGAMKRVLLKELVNTDDSDFLHFIEACLRLDPYERITPDDALKHPFIQKQYEKNDLFRKKPSIES